MGGAAVLVVQVVGVFPDIEGQQRPQVVGDGVVGARVLGDGKGSVGRRGLEPDPAAAEEAGAFLLEFGLEGFQGAPLGFYLRHEGRFLDFARNDRRGARKD